MHPSRVGRPRIDTTQIRGVRHGPMTRLAVVHGVAPSWYGKTARPAGEQPGSAALDTPTGVQGSTCGWLGHSPLSRRGTPMTEWRDAISWCGRRATTDGGGHGSYCTWSSPVSASEVACTLPARRGAVRSRRCALVAKDPPGRRQGSIMRSSPTGGDQRGWRAESAAHGLVLGNSCWLPVGPRRPGRDRVRRAGILYLIRPEADAPCLRLSTSRSRSGSSPRGARPDPGEVWGVRECRNDGQVARQVVAVPLVTAAVRCGACIRRGSSCLRCVLSGWSPAGVGVLAGAQLPGTGRSCWSAASPTRASRTLDLIGGPVESVFQPEWASADSLFVVSDRSRW